MNEEYDEEEEEEEYEEEYKDDKWYWDRIEPLLINYLMSNQEPLITEIEKILGDYIDEYAVSELAKKFGDKVHNRSITTKQWKVFHNLIKKVVESGDYDDLYCSLLIDIVTFDDVKIGYITIISGDKQYHYHHHVKNYLCRILDQ
ncbi:MAG: hypothetical protein KAU62_02035 [Candidatus Heimdallarchaeota archaeon]|nr:hypothetical protein [Candidatus Heimdallarchaeota archaeon]MCK4609913.1 hypothetical protein [Candidatus Heimdallarchaeota archaeon]